jgi:hypothetical protein
MQKISSKAPKMIWHVTICWHGSEHGGSNGASGQEKEEALARGDDQRRAEERAGH